MSTLLLPFHFDANRLLQEVLEIPSHHFREILSSHITPGGLLALDLLVPDPDLAKQQQYVPIPNPLLSPESYLYEALNSFSCEKHLARIHRLQAGARISEHIDGNLNYHSEYLRLHIPVSTDGEAHFVLDGKPLTMQPGECWGLNVGLKHHVANESATERIHLVIDCKRDDWLQQVLADAGHAASAPGPFDRMTLPDLKYILSSLENLPAEHGDTLCKELQALIAQRELKNN